LRLTFHGATGEVTGSCYLLEVNGSRILLECGLIQGRREDEQRNHAPFPFDAESIDAMVLSHAHIDHSGRIPALINSGFRGPVYTHRASRDLCRIMLRDAGFLNEKDAEWENRKRERKGLPPVQPLFTKEDADNAMHSFRPLDYDKKYAILPGFEVRLRDAGHILGSAIVEVWLEEQGSKRKLVFSGDLGHKDAPILRDPTPVEQADLLILESTYGDRLHRGWQETFYELGEVFTEAEQDQGNILIPAFAVGRTQELLYLFEKYYRDWRLDRWQIFLDSPMAIRTTEIYRKYPTLYDIETKVLWQVDKPSSIFHKLILARTSLQSMRINTIKSGAIVIAGSGMCTGGRIRHHLKHNVWRQGSHVVMVGFQAQGTPGRALVDGARKLRLWGETIRVNAKIHTIGGLSAHADQAGLSNWYGCFKDAPKVYLVHGEETGLTGLEERLRQDHNAPVHIAQRDHSVEL